MKRALVIVVLAVVANVAYRALHQSGVEQAREEAYAELKALPPVARDFTSPEGAILCLEDAYRRHDIEAAVAAKDFKTEARLMLQRAGYKDFVDEGMIARTSEALASGFRMSTTASWPDVEGGESFFTKREPHADKVVLVTEVRRLPDGGVFQQQLLVAETPEGWRVLNPVYK
ncbi:hypothetical protein [Prosthecobacter sp.]|uniref:hypothetical protein n=1 Tax=Prosthecobacter sp. TaxID=1965333 RepID=UPI001DB01C65|nr:hypothetical protein [Prosthecobacter sp.]MCB1279654.1 hypothetical protein [Prosthecobacter sp.]